MYKELTARGAQVSPEELLRDIFKGYIKEFAPVDALFADSSFNRVIGVSNLPFKVPAVMEMLKNRNIACFLTGELEKNCSVLAAYIRETNDVKVYLKDAEKSDIYEADIPGDVREAMLDILSGVEKWAGLLNEKGEHEIDLRTPVPGPHFYVNLLMGSRIGYDHALQTTPKSVVDRLGRGSFRSHAASQVLATRWDMRQEENGFPANRQFYLVEDCRRIFYSADPNDSNIKTAVCTHSQNHTTIKYTTKCGLEITRLIFILPQMAGMPLATEVQQIKIKNTGNKTRNLKLVYTGMFGSAVPGALFEDVLYSNITMQSKVLRNEDGTIAAVGPDYYLQRAREDMRFHTMIIHKGENASFPREFCMNYNEFVGNGTLENPEGILSLSNRLYRKGPGFFAVSGELMLEPGEECLVDNFTGIVSAKVNADFNEDTFGNEIGTLIGNFSKPGETVRVFEKSMEFFKNYSNFMQIQSSDKSFNTYFNENLPFQVLYQTFVSRSFCQTQKGYREMGFREIQDIYASMYYFAGMGMSGFVKDLLKEWCSMVFEFGYAYHNFFWVGKEAGKWSDDALWFIQAVFRYINLTGDMGFLDEECPIAGTDPIKTRSVYQTIKAILRYSGEISVGKHGLPLLDFADWNDCLKLDSDYIDGITKEKLYLKQVEKSGNFGEPFKSDYSESVMNAFLLKAVVDEMIYLSGEKGDREYKDKLRETSCALYNRLQEHAWKDDFFARVLFNRYKNGEFTYLGAKGDGLSADPKLSGSYFLNSFSWAILSDSANEEQIKTMLGVIESVLKTPFGIKLVSPADLGKVSKNTAAGEYFPGDRENGGVFKHACMMAAAAMFKAAKQVDDRELAEKLGSLAYWMIDLTIPYKAMENPFSLCGNPRFCTQYNNSETGENIGPMLSGTSTWLTLAMMSAMGIEYMGQSIQLNPVLRADEQCLQYSINGGKCVYKVKITKPKGFYRIKDGNSNIKLDGKSLGVNIIPVFEDNKEHIIEVIFE